MSAAALGVAGMARRAFDVAIHSLFRNQATTSRMDTFVGHGNYLLSIYVIALFAAAPAKNTDGGKSLVSLWLLF
jgi:hypothetical protein